MKTISVTISDELYELALARAARGRVSLEQVIEQFLQGFATPDPELRRLEDLRHDVTATVREFDAADRLTREQLYDRALR